MPRIGVTVYDLLLSCPGDVMDLKDVIDACVKSFNASIGEANNVRIEVKHWTTDSFSQSGDKPQNILNNQFVDNCDLCVALLGTRFGTPTDNYDSGTEEEIERMLNQGKQVFLYFVERKVDPSEMDINQYAKVKAFREKYTDKGIYNVVKSAEELRTVFQNELSLYFLNLVAQNIIQQVHVIAPNLIISSTDSKKRSAPVFHTNYKRSPFVKEKEEAIKSLIHKISETTIIESTEEVEDFKSEISDEELEKMSTADFFQAAESKKITTEQFHRLMGTKPPEYKKVEIGEIEKQLISVFCEKHDIALPKEFCFLGNLQEERKFPQITAFGNITKSYIGSDSEQEKYNLLQELLCKLQEYSQIIEFFGAIDSLFCVSLQIENQGNTFDEDIDVKIFVEKNCVIDVGRIPKPRVSCLKEIVDLDLPELLFCNGRNAEVEEFSNYPVNIPYSIPFSNPFKSRTEEIAEQYKEYQYKIEHVFCYDLRETKDEEVLCFNVPYLKQNVKMFFPSYLFFERKPNFIRYEIRSKHSPEVYRGEVTITRGEEN